MDLLEAVNRILPKLGEHPVASLTARHSTVAMILDELTTQIRTVCQSGWWFNEYHTTLIPDVERKIAMPKATLAFVADDPDLLAIQRGDILFNGAEVSDEWEIPVPGTIKQLLPFDQLPESAAQYAWYSALCSAYVTDIGMGQDLQVWAQAATAAMQVMESEHLDQKRYSTARSYRYGKLRRAMRG